MRFCLDPGHVIPEAALAFAFDLDQCTHLSPTSHCSHQTSGNKRSSSHRGTEYGIRHESLRCPHRSLAVLFLINLRRLSFITYRMGLISQ